MGLRPLLRPLPSPTGNPAWALSSPLSESARLLGKAGVSVPVGSPSCGLLGKRALTPSAYFGSFVSGGSASGSHQRLRCSRTLDRKETLARSSLTRQASFFSTRDNSPPQSGAVGCFRASASAQPPRRSSLTRQASFFSTRDNSLRSPARRDALELPRPHSPPRPKLPGAAGGVLLEGR